jgi:hypothetical protein
MSAYAYASSLKSATLTLPHSAMGGTAFDATLISGLISLDFDEYTFIIDALFCAQSCS